MQTVLIAGGAGFIGSHLCESLLNKKLRVICLDNNSTGSKKNVESFQENENFSFLLHDVRDSLAITEKIDFIFHLASPASPNKKNPNSFINKPIESLLSNSLGTYNLLELAKKNNSHFLFASTSEIYGDPEIFPQTETYNGNVNPTGPRAVYDEAKRFGEAITMAYLRKFELDVRIIRIFNTYGPRMHPQDGRVVSNFINQALSGNPITIYGDGKQTRSFCYVSDMVDGIERAMFTEGTKGEVINLGNPDEKTIKDFAAIIKNKLNSKSEIVFEELPEDDPRKRKPDIGKANEKLKWKPQVSLEIGLGKTIEYFRNL